MITYFINSTLCSALLLAVYYLFLYNKTTFVFNRFYLLAIIVLSYTIPLLSFKRYQAPIPTQNIVSSVTESIPDYSVAQIDKVNVKAEVAKEPVNYPVFVYEAVFCLLLIRFIKNLVTILLTLKNGLKIKVDKNKIVLISKNLTPHTFLNYIILPKADYLNLIIEPEILKHETIHAKQWHTLDVIFIELVQLFCWFNPIIPILKIAIQTNHEFIADEAVLQHTNNLNLYQNLLISKLTQPKNVSISSQFNYSLTKKRLIMMTKTTTKMAQLLSKLAIVPILIAAFMLFSKKTEAQTEPSLKDKVAIKNTTEETKTTKPNNYDIRFGRTEYPHTVEGVSDDELKKYAGIAQKYIDKIHEDRKNILRLNVSESDKEKLIDIFKRMSLQQQKEQNIKFSYLDGYIPKNTITRAQFEKWKNPKFCGLWINEKRVNNNALNNFKPEDFDQYFQSGLTKRAFI
jgi:beta-lactamase regulating signal transducer with metallopeptidase domain